MVKSRDHGRRAHRWGAPLTAGVVGLTAAILAAPAGQHGAGHVAVAATSSHMEMPTAAAYVRGAPTLVPEGWTARASDAAAGHPADAVLDGRPSTYWQSSTSSRAASHALTLDLRAAQPVAGLVYTPAHVSTPARLGSVGAITRFEVSLSLDDAHFGAPVATGTWADTPATKEVGWAATDARFVRLTALGSGGQAVAASSVALTGPLLEGSTTAAGPAVAHTSTNPAVVGSWGATIGLPLVPAAAALLPDDRLLVWSADQDLSFGGDNSANYTQTAIVDLSTGVVSPETVTNTGHNMFCPGVAILADGEIMVTGGDSDDRTSIYDPATNSWHAGPPMNVGRGYQGMTLLSTGQAFTLGGSWSGALGGKVAEVWSPTGAWRTLPGVPADPMDTQDAQGVYRADNHGWFIATSGGRVLQAGPSKQMNWITTAGAGTITGAGLRGTSGDAMNGNAVYYDVNKVITMGGAPDYQDSNATAASYEIDLSGANPTVTQVGNLHYARTFANSVVLPTGQVVVMGGESYGVPFSDSTSVLNAELWNPATGKYTVMAAEAEPRNYHSVAVLLPDGRVFSGGGGLCGTCSTNHPDGQIFTPPYLYNPDGTLAARPTIVSAPATAATGQTISVTTGQATGSFSMVRYGESTHSVDNDQRRIPLHIVAKRGSTYTLAMPSDPGIALPGPYMLFAMAHGVPSTATSLTITTPGLPPPADSYGRAVLADGPAIYWPLGDAAGGPAADLSGNGDTGTYSGSGIAYRTSSPVEGPSGTGITLDGVQGQISSSESSTDPTPYSEETWFSTTSTAGGYLTGFANSAGGLSSSDDRQVWMSNDGQLDFGIYDGQAVVVQSPGSYNDGRWHQVVATQGPDGMTLYVDGQLVATNPTADAQDYAGYWEVGGERLSGWPDQPTSNYFGGSISDVAFFTTELHAAQVAAEYAAG